MKPWFLAALIGATLNMADALLTARAVELGYAKEANPILAATILFSMPLFYLLKGLVSTLFVFLGSKTDQILAKMGVLVGLGTYIGITLYHFIGIFLG